MYQLLFKNRFNALVFVAIMLFSVRILVGTEGEEGALQNATLQIADDPARIVPTQALPVAKPQRHASDKQQDDDDEVLYGFTPEADLVDEAEGFDPSGFSADPSVDLGEPEDA
ncbi:hypothetical protein GCM10011371_18110 [Novosphingobium marinum]|uniref:Uncharacterized protein n=1 Tax=Novosphingobium marinum TaxID=1514948 RepID=A0A7Y9XZF0_9SPHN|nr:hypothetical protein [Novosphingobium marinum]NYH95923.1 hypothetical protein [Novosphingobium marinum]GGC31046.1 hypothetical protein GCM10011371_18110 [Novosphingobium marinum]